MEEEKKRERKTKTRSTHIDIVFHAFHGLHMINPTSLHSPTEHKLTLILHVFTIRLSLSVKCRVKIRVKFEDINSWIGQVDGVDLLAFSFFWLVVLTGEGMGLPSWGPGIDPLLVP